MSAIDLQTITSGEEIRLFLDGMLRTMIDNPESFEIRATPLNEGIRYVIHASPIDQEKIRGARGETIRSLRVILNAIGLRLDRAFSVEVVSTVRHGPGPFLDCRTK